MILLDEVEKAHPDVFNVLLQVLDDGSLTDGQGRTVDFRNTVIVMTSNLGSQMIQEMAGEENYDAMKARSWTSSAQHFRPEFINRVDDVVVFHPLGREHIRKIVDIQLGYLHERLADRDMRIHLSDEARDKLAEAGFDPVYGARPLKRAIQQQVENPLAQEILQGSSSRATSSRWAWKVTGSSSRTRPRSGEVPGTVHLIADSRESPVTTESIK